MDYQKKTMFIIKELELSARQVGFAIGKSGSVVSDKKNQIKSNKFLQEDFERLQKFYIKKLEKITAQK